MIELRGIGASKGIAIGRIHKIDRNRTQAVQRTLKPADLNKEVARFDAALAAAREELAAVMAQIPPEAPTDIAAFIDTHILMLEDAALSSVPRAHIREQRCNAEWALKEQHDALVSVFDAMDDDYLRTRRDDVSHVVARVMRYLDEGPGPKARKRAPRLTGKVILADDLAPSDTVLMQHQGIAAFVTEVGGPNSHTAILARSLGIPAVVGLHDSVLELWHGQMVVVDGREGIVLAAPSRAVVADYRGRQADVRRARTARQRLRQAAPVTRDDVRVALHANVELPEDMALVQGVNADGVGLYRTEYLFMNRTQPPDEEEQYQAYAAMVDAAGGAPVTVRTLDLGADKQVDGTRPGASIASNPALGLRAVRLCLREPELFRPQLRAILRASARGPVRLMVPMVSNTDEMARVLSLIGEYRRELESESQPFDPHMPLGAMVEVPAAAICADIFAKALDFLSIGTNDLIQYTIAIDRVDDEVNYLYDPLHPAVLRLIETTIKAGARARIPVAMCGEMASDTRFTRLLLGLGLREFSVHPNALLEVKQAIVSSSAGETTQYVRRLMRSTRSDTRESLMQRLNDSLDMSGY